MIDLWKGREMESEKPLNAYRDRIHTWAKSKGWWDRKQDTIEAKLLLIHSEISEAVEALRDVEYDGEGRPNPEQLRKVIYREFTKPDGFAIEIADTVIRILDLCGRLDIDLDGMVEEKMLYNERRAMRHGGRAF
jgi:NTP pyrophosphatase (non-canonical NTP hydrolase)